MCQLGNWVKNRNCWKTALVLIDPIAEVIEQITVQPWQSRLSTCACRGTPESRVTFFML